MVRPMTEQPPPRQRHYGCFLLLLTLLLILAGVKLFQQTAVVQGQETRRIAYAATATALAQPIPPAIPLPQPTPTPVLIPTTQDLHILPTSLPTPLPSSDVLSPATLFPHDGDLLNVLVLGSDRWGDRGAYRTDVIIVVSLNRTTQTISLLSIPRDLYVYIPGWGMDRINTAEIHQLQTHQSSHRLGLLAETIEYNLGVEIHHLARVDFDGFRALIDRLGGLTVPVDCPITGFRLQSPELDPDNLQNWAPFTLEAGVHRMDGSLALWYVRQRTNSSDFERNRRQQIVLRALWNQLVNSSYVRDLPAVWGDLTGLVETDLTLEDALSLLPLMLSLDASRIESHFLGLDEVNLSRSPTGASILVIDPVPFQTTMQRFFTPPTQNQLVQELARVHVISASSVQDADRLAVARLEWAGFVAVPQGQAGRQTFTQTTIYDHTGRAKGNSLNALQTVLGVSDEAVIAAPEANRTADFTVVIGEDYTPCVTSAWRAFPQSD